MSICQHNQEAVKLLQSKKTYISGKMTGLPNFNYPAFEFMHGRLMDLGVFNILNPAKIANGDTTKSYGFYIRESLKMVAEAEAMIMLNGWEKSKGANLEYQAARAMDIPIFNSDFELIPETLTTQDEDILVKANELIHGERQKSYGSPKSNFTKIGRIWGAINDIPDIEPEKVALMMAGLKIARESHAHTQDNLVDGAAYFATIPMIKKDLT